MTPNSKHEYEVLITYTEVHSVFVMAEDEDAAKELAIDLLVAAREEEAGVGPACDNKPELREWNLDAMVNWSDEED